MKFGEPFNLKSVEGCTDASSSSCSCLKARSRRVGTCGDRRPTRRGERPPCRAFYAQETVGSHLWKRLGESGCVAGMCEPRRRRQRTVSCLCEADTLIKSYAIDGRLLRTGSANWANWSPTGLKRQDNDVPYESSREEAEQFEKKFTEISSRAGNSTVTAPGL